MNYRPTDHPLPKLIEPVLQSGRQVIDSLVSETWQELRLGALLTQVGFSKRTGHDASTLVFLHLMWRWLGCSSVGFFCRESLHQFYAANRGAVYDLLNNPHWNWRSWNLRAAKGCIERHARGIRALVVDDSVKARSSKKMDGVSSHYDHLQNRHVLGHQAVVLGLICEAGFFPLDSELSVSKSQRQFKGGSPCDGRSRAARRFDEAVRLSKIELAARMVRRVRRIGIEASYLVADSWYGNKAMIRLAADSGLIGVLRMKNGNMKYRMRGADGVTRMLTAGEIYQSVVRGNWHRSQVAPGGKWQTYEIQLEVNLAQSARQAARWQSVKLLYVRGVNLDSSTQPSKKDFALFLSTDAEMSAAQMLEVYAMRWSIEVYFREAKQNLKWLGEQSRHFAAHAASLHLSAVCYLILLHARLSREFERLALARKHIHETLTMLNYARQLWDAFRLIIAEALGSIQSQLGCDPMAVMKTVDQRMEIFLAQVLQLEPHTIRQDHDPIEQPG